MNTTTQIKTNRLGEFLRHFVKNYGSVVIFLIIWIISALFIPRFADWENLALIIKQAAIPIIACLGMTMVLMTGGIDLSLGYSIGLTSIIVGMMIKTYDLPIWFSIIVTLLIGCLIGLFNGFVIETIQVPAFIATLGTGYIYYGLAQIFSHGEDVSRFPKEFLAIGKTKIFGGLTSTVLISLFLCVIVYYLLHLSTFGRSLSAYGFSKETSRLSGLPTGLINILVYVICGFLTAVVGILLTIRVNCGQPTMGGGNYTFEVITSAIIGGASFFGGIGSVIGSVFGVLILKVIENCINLMGIPYYMYQSAMGLMILFAIIFENVKNKKL